MDKPWYEEIGFKDENEAYVDSFAKVKEGTAQGLSFEQACSAINIKDKAARGSVVGECLKALIGERHLSGEGESLQALAKALGLPLKRLEKAKKEMLGEVEDTAIEAYKASTKDNATDPPGP